MALALFTGFPGFLGAALLPRLLERSPNLSARCLVQRRYMAVARQQIDRIEVAHAGLRDRIEVVEGDIAGPGLGLKAEHLEGVVEVWHLAAVYDLSVDAALAHRVNVEGTRNVLELCAALPGLERLHYVSTCYVSGRHAGPFGETDLDVGQRFSNHYEETKFLAEVAVAEHRAAGLPVTVYRPAVVVGDSVTGETQKYDGPYYALQLIMRQSRIAFMPVFGDPRA